MASGPWHQRPGARIALLVALSAGAFLASLEVPFLDWDDTYYVTTSSRTQRPGLDGFLQLWSFSDFWRGKRVIEFFPLRDSAYWVLWQRFGRNPVPFHAASIAAHTACVLLVLALGRRLRLSPQVSFWGAALFAVHPIHVESVAWIAGLKDPMVTAFMLGSVVAYLRYREGLRPRDYALSLLCLVAALLVKSVAICTPVLLLAAERLSPPHAPWREVVRRLLGPAAIAALFLVQYVLIGRVAGVITGPHGGDWWTHAFFSAWAMVRYVQQAFVPASFALQHCFRPPSGLFDWRLPVIAFTFLALAAIFWVGRRRLPIASLLVAWFVAALLPVANIIPFPAIMADRYLYASSVASCLALSLVLSRIPGSTRGLLLGATVAVLGMVTALRCVVWQREKDLWAEVVANPVCREDPQATSSAVFFKYARFLRDPGERLEVAVRGAAMAGFDRLPLEVRCTYLVDTSATAILAGDLGRAEVFARRATGLCPFAAVTWTALASATARTDPAAARDAAARAGRLSPTAEQQWRLGDARLMAGDLEGLEDLAAATQRAPAVMCARFLRWMELARPPERESLERARRACEGPR